MPSSDSLSDIWPEVGFSPIEQALLNYLIQQGGRTIPSQELLREVWGYEKGVKSRTLPTTVQRLRQKIEIDPSIPTTLVTVRGRGYQLCLETRVEPTADATVESLERRLADWLGPSTVQVRLLTVPRDQRTNITASGDSFIGRALDLETLTTLWTTGARLITLRGAAGLGKSRLCREFALSIMRRDGCAAWFCDLSSATTAAEALSAVGRCIGMLNAPDATPPLTQIAEQLRRDGTTLLALDNFEQLPDAAAEQVQSLLALVDSLRVVVTSRSSLGIDDESVYNVPPLAQEHAVQLLRDRVRALDLGASSTSASADLETVASLLQGVPLALEMAAARARILPLSELGARLETSFSVLRLGRTGAPDRQQTMQQAIDWSWQLCSEDEQRALVQFAVFKGGCPVEAAGKVIDVERDVYAVIDGLLDKSMLRTWSAAGQHRVGLFASVREFAVNHGDVGLDGARARHADWAVAYADTWSARRDSDPAAIVALMAELDNLVHAHRWLIATRSPHALKLAVALWPLFYGRFLPDGYVEMLGETRDKIRLAPADQARAHLTLAWSLTQHKKPHRVESELRLGLDVVAEDDPTRVYLLSHTASHANQEGRTEAALEWSAKAVQLLGELGCAAAAPTVLNDYGTCLVHAKRHREAADAYRDALSASEEVHTPRKSASILRNLGSVLTRMGESDEGLRCFEQAAELALRFDEPATLYTVRLGIATAHARAGEIDKGDAEFQKLLEQDRMWGGRMTTGTTWVNAGICALLVGDAKRSRDHLRQALRQLRDGKVTGSIPVLTRAYLLISCCKLGFLDEAESMAANLNPDGAQLAAPETVEVDLACGHLDLLRALRAHRSGDVNSAAQHRAAAAARLAKHHDEAMPVDSSLAVGLLKKALDDAPSLAEP